MPPPELVWAMQLDVSRLRPWEWAMCEADVYYQVTTMHAIVHEAQQEKRTLAEQHVAHVRSIEEYKARRTG
jgi:hypothetical protein